MADFTVKLLLLFFSTTIFNLKLIDGHGMLMEPVNRGSAWRKGFNTPKNYDDNANFCGGLWTQVTHGGKCGVCGDRYGAARPRANENTGTYGTGTIVKTYKRGQSIDLMALLTANHKGYFRFALCPLKHSRELETEECFNKYPLILKDGSTKYLIDTNRVGEYKIGSTLPDGLICDQCVLRWEYVAGNNWGQCGNNTSALGCGPQETFRTCSDIRII